MAHPSQQQLIAYPVSSYTFGTKPPKWEKDNNPQQRMERLKEKYQREGVRRTVDGVLLVHEHNHPHVLLVQVGSSFFKLPGGRLRPGEDEVDGLMRKLNTLLAPAAQDFRPGWRVGECLATYYRPNFENAIYPYCPPHVTRPKEVKRIWHVVLPDRSFFSIPKNMRLVAVPLFEIYDNPQRYGPVIASIPQLLSRFAFVLAGAPGGQSVAKAPSLAPPQQQQHAAAQQGYGQQAPGSMALAPYGQAPQQQQPQQAQQAQQQQQQRMGGITVSLQPPQAGQPQMGGMAPAGQALQSMQSGGMGGYQPQEAQQQDSLFVDFEDE